MKYTVLITPNNQVVYLIEFTDEINYCIIDKNVKWNCGPGSNIGTTGFIRDLRKDANRTDFETLEKAKVYMMTEIL